MIETITLIAGFISIVSTMIGGVLYLRQEIKKDIEVESQRIEKQSQRSDHLYQILIDLVKRGGQL